jgi:tetratricopeptide (TPR) repeat protein
MYARLVSAMIQQERSVDGGTQAMLAAANAASGYFAEVDDHRGLTLAHLAFSDVAWMAYDVTGGSRHVSLAGDHAEAAGRFAEAAIYRGSRVVSLLPGDCPVDEALTEIQQVLDETVGRQYRSVAQSMIGTCAALQGRDDDAETAWSQAERLAAEVPGSVAARSLAFWRSEAMIAGGRWSAATSDLELLAARHREAESWGMLSTIEAHHAIVLLQAGQVERAREAVTSALAHAAGDDVATHALAHAALSWLTAVDGDSLSAQQHAHEATRLLPKEVLLERALLHGACAEAMLVLGDRDAAVRHRQTAIELYERKGAVTGAAYHRQRLAELSG